ncbi:hypothetical protein V500_08660 [Pseudogymnoascus sp. VKM F-4518 (FW-2643)]|nr:hypothetical protein V500_08660 [Pseudogymnoascus sp. VKM F-4518 (FW-2643)]
MFCKVFFWASSFALAAVAVPAPGPCSGACGTHDPSLIRRVSDGTYFLFSTNGHVGVASAPSIAGPWTQRGAALPGPVKLPQGNDIWAPDVSLVGNTYHMYYAVSSFGSQNSAIGLATSTTLEPGSWTDHGSIGLSSTPGSPYNAIDPNLVKSGNSYYLNVGSFWGDIYQAQMSTDLTRPTNNPLNMIFNPIGSHSVEGSFAFQNGNYFYMFWSAGQCCGLNTNRPPPGGEYMIKVCRSNAVTGPYVDQNGVSCTAGGGTIVLQSHDNIYAPGGQGVINDPTHGPVLYYHYMNTNIGIGDESANSTPTTSRVVPTSNISSPSGAPMYGQWYVTLFPKEETLLTYWEVEVSDGLVLRPARREAAMFSTRIIPSVTKTIL